MIIYKWYNYILLLNNQINYDTAQNYRFLIDM